MEKIDPEISQKPPAMVGNMQAMIFCAGMGTRFKPWTDKHPKALALVNKKSLLQRNIEYLQQYDIRDVVINVHHFSDQIIKAVEDNDGWGSNILISHETDLVLETGGGLLKAQPLLANGNKFVTLNADILTDLNLTDLIQYHEQRKAFISLAVSDRRSSRNFLLNKQDLLCGWQNNETNEKRMAIASNILIPKSYSGIAIFEPSIFELIPQRGKFSLVDTYLSLAATENIFGYDHSGGKFIDVGKPEAVAIAEGMFE